jgi:hypothetical protein
MLDGQGVSNHRVLSNSNQDLLGVVLVVSGDRGDDIAFRYPVRKRNRDRK